MNLKPYLYCLAVAAMLFTSHVEAAPQLDGKRLTVGADDVQSYLDGSFPRSQSALGGLMALTMSQPRLALPAGSRLQLGMDVALSTAGGAPVPLGTMTLSSALRYDGQTRGFHLEQPSIEEFRATTGGNALDSRTRGLLNAFLADYARREPIYRIDPTLATVLGALQVQSIGIENGRIAVQFNQSLKGLLPQTLMNH